MAFSVIPKGAYCYERVDTGDGVYYYRHCPYWTIDKSKPYQANGHCLLLDLKDWEADGVSLIWDQVKECGINYGNDPY